MGNGIRASFVIAALSWCLACASPTAPQSPLTFNFDFGASSYGWTAGWADYPVVIGPRPPVAEYRRLPEELDPTRSGLLIWTGGEDVFTYYKGKVTGLPPSAIYRASFNVEIATQEPNGCAGAGTGPAGEGTVVKSGASPIEPVAVPVGTFYRMNIDKGDGGRGGPDALAIGHIANSLPCQAENGRIVKRWEFKQLSSGTSTLAVRSASDGSLWFIVGADTAFFGSVPIYYTRFTATLTPE